MSSVSLNFARVSMQMQGSLLMGTLNDGQLNLLKVQQQLSTGQRLNLPSDDPAAAVSIMNLNQQISTNTNYSSNLSFAAGMLAQGDSTLGTLNSLINQAQGIANSQIGASSTADQRAAQAQVVNSLLSQALDLANTQYQGQSIFGGQNTTQNPFVSTGGGYKYQGTTTAQGMVTPTGGTIDYTLSGDQAFGAVSSQVVGYKTLTPALSATTRLSDLGGASGSGIARGPITLTVGATTSTIDLSNAATVGDVVNIINAGLTAAGSDASVALSGGSLAVTGDSTQAITFADGQTSTTAASLGIAGTVAATTTLTGTALQPKITATTTLASLNNGAGIDPAGIIITNGSNTATVSLAGLNTVGDLINAVNNSGTNVQAQINAAGTGINLFNPLSGTQMTVGENGGTTADELGIRSLNATTPLANFNNGTGVTPISGTLAGPKGQITVTRTDGSAFNVQVDGISSPSQLIAAINNAAGNTTVTAALNATGNGITLTDTTGGAGNLTVSAGPNFVSNGSDLGILRAGSGATLTGTNIALSTDDFSITRQDGTSFTVSLGGSPPASTVQDVLNRINNADGNTNPATQVTASLNASGNGITLTDASTGTGALTVTALNGSQAAAQLGIAQAQTSAGQIVGSDNNPLQPQGIFSTLTLLRDALLNNDDAGIQRAANLLGNDSSRAIEAQGIVGAREQDVAARQSQATGDDTSLRQALSLLADTDFTTAATRLQQLETAYQASLQVAQTATNMSLLDFLK